MGSQAGVLKKIHRRDLGQGGQGKRGEEKWGGPSTSAFYTPPLPGLERGPGGSQGPVGVAEPLVLRSEETLRIRADVKSPSKPRSLTLL